MSKSAQQVEKIVELPWPTKGVDRSQAQADQPGGSCFDCRNVRDLAPITARRGGGKRAGSIKALTDRVGGAALSINSIYAAVRPASGTPASNATYASAVEYWTNYANGGVKLTDPWVCFERSITAGNAISVREPGSAVQFITRPQENPAAGLWMCSPQTNDSFVSGVAVQGKTTNDIEATIRASKAQAAATDNYALGYAGVFARASADLSQMVIAWLDFTGANALTLRLEAYGVTAGNITKTTINLPGVSTFTLPGGVVSGSLETYTLRIQCDPENIKVVASGPGVNYTGTVADTTFASNDRAGVVNMRPSTGAASDYKIVFAIRYAREVIRQDTPVLSITGGSRTGATTRYVLPSGLIAGRSKSGSALSEQSTSAGAYSNSSLPTFPVVDTVLSTLRTDNSAGDGTRSNASKYLVPVSLPAGGKIWAVDLQFKSDRTNTTGGDDSICAMIRMATDRSAGVRVRLVRSVSSTTAAIGVATITQIIVEQLVLGGSFAISNTSTISLSGALPVIDLDEPIRVTFDATTINLVVRNKTLYTISNNWLGGNGYYAGVDVTPLSTTNAESGYAFGATITDVTPPAVSLTPNVGSIDVLVTAGSAFYHGNLSTGQPWRAIGSGLINPQAQFAVLGGKFYATDGSKAWIIDPVTNNSADTFKEYTALQGVLPAGCPLIAAWRGRIAMARPSDNPTMWYVSRTLAPRDWDTGSLVDVRTKAYAGNNADLGQPPEPINALIPYGDEMLIFGCQSSMWALVGDPGNGGQLINLTYKNGVVGPRAWCFDQWGNLFFYGNNGLYVLPRNSREPKPVAMGRYPSVLSDQDTNSVQVQMAFDNGDRHVMVFFRNVDGSARDPNVIAYDPAADAIWPDTHTGYSIVSVCEIDGLRKPDRRVLLGCDDGYVRKVDDSALSDDGSAIDAWVRFPAFNGGNDMAEMTATELTVVGQNGSGSVGWKLFVGNSDREVNAIALSNGGAASGTYASFGQGFNYPAGLRVTGASLQLVVRQTSSSAAFAMERAVLSYKFAKRRRENP